MLPVGTPANAIVYNSAKMKPLDMVHKYSKFHYIIPLLPLRFCTDQSWNCDKNHDCFDPLRRDGNYRQGNFSGEHYRIFFDDKQWYIHLTLAIDICFQFFFQVLKCLYSFVCNKE